MSQVRVSYTYEPEDDAVDDDHEMGVTDAEFERVTSLLMSEGAEDIEFTQIAS